MTIQSREYNGVAIDYSNDMYTIDLVIGSNIYSTTATYVLNGLYSAQVTPSIAGTYQLQVNLYNDYTTRTGASNNISGYPLTVTVVPGEIDPL